MKRVILIVLLAATLCYAPEIEKVDTFANRKGRIVTRPIHTAISPEGSSSAEGKHGTWDYEAGYLYIWLSDTVAMRVALEYFGGARFLTVEDSLPIQTVAGTNLRTVEVYTP